jgi:ketosteroid isomerase-like protein
MFPWKSVVSAAFLALGVLSTAPALSRSPIALPRTPQEVPTMFERLFNAADVDGLMRLYGKDSVFVPAPGVELRDPLAIQGALQKFLATKLPMNIKVRQIYAAEKTALIVFDWTMEGVGPDGKPMKMAGTGTDVVTRQSDGTWLYAVDNPMGITPAAH